MSSHILIDIGFIYEKLPAGTHICQVYSDERERNASLLAFLLRGILAGEKCACFTENLPEKTIRDHFAESGLDYQEIIDSKAFSFARTREAYFTDNTFDPEVMLEVLKNFHKESIKKGFSNARVIGEMSPEISHIRGGERLLEYECKVTLLLEEYPITSICQYDAREFDGALIMDVVKVHPMMIVNGGVIQNPFFVPPQEFLNQSA
ncbi:MEDS domain-containing protein [Marispirochaeta aestuarii]|uniref:MEDS domain-containing protein n=1 Tax=Marispirochaeta aestuarii TaxID=1963862 RepID=UPI0029C82557|nr:MEDS domain-containing protein [Marispirochaeta aestuarii]